MSELYWREVGPSDGPVVVFVHGLLGQGKNWGTVTKRLADRYRCIMLDAPNHGRSPWREEITYPAMADEVADFIAETFDGPVTLVGHSMGGKIVMRIALTRPELVARLCVVDMSPVSGSISSFNTIFRALQDLDLRHVASRADVEEKLRDSIPNDSVRLFLMQNLHHDRHPEPGQPSWHWQMNLAGLAEQRVHISDWPFMTAGTTYDGPVLWINGGRSHYVLDEHTASMRRYFPTVRKRTVKRAGHWVHSDQPEEFYQLLRGWLEDTDGLSPA